MRSSLMAKWGQFGLIILLFFSAMTVAVLVMLYFVLIPPNRNTSQDSADKGSYELDVITRWDQAVFIPDCRKNYAETMPSRACGGSGEIVMQYFQGPDKVPRNQNFNVVEISSLPNMFVNRIASAMYPSQYFTLHKRCTEREVSALMDWIASDLDIQRDDVITVTYLSPEDPWAFCLHRDGRSWDSDIRRGREPVLEYHEFWLWRSGRVIGVAKCSSTARRRTETKIFPHCGFDLWWGGGNYQMSIGAGIPAASFRIVLTRLDSVTETFWNVHREEIAEYQFDRSLFYSTLVLSERAEHTLSQLERDVK